MKIEVMKMADICSGLCGASEAFKNRGHDIITCDINPQFNPDLLMSVEELLVCIRYGVIHLDDVDAFWVSPPCKCFSVASISHHWDKNHQPKTKQARDAIQLVKDVLKIIEIVKPKYWFIENPRGMLRKMPFMQDLPRTTVTYCQYGESRMKPTDIWTNALEVWTPRSMCKNGDSCHEWAPRGARTGTQGIKGSALRAKVPYELSKEICIALETVMAHTAAANSEAPHDQ